MSFYWEQVRKGPKSWPTNFDGLGEMIKGNFADMCGRKNHTHVDLGPTNTIKSAQAGSKDLIGMHRYLYISIFTRNNTNKF